MIEFWSASAKFDGDVIVARWEDGILVVVGQGDRALIRDELQSRVDEMLAGTNPQITPGRSAALEAALAAMGATDIRVDDQLTDNDVPDDAVI